jgi:hypothetical protein
VVSFVAEEKGKRVGGGRFAVLYGDVLDATRACCGLLLESVVNRSWCLGRELRDVWDARDPMGEGIFGMMRTFFYVTDAAG